ncbi:MAG: DUF4397 domain-containing protein [Calditrichaeota bacterium]|nr:DUF4397 domain-containing protein [Calditrichota bacterium]
MKISIHAKTFGLLSVLLVVFFILSCADVPTNAPPLPKFKAKVRIINAATDVAQATILMDGKNFANVAFKAGTDYTDLAAGKHTFQIQGQEVDTLFIDTDFVGTVYAVKKTNNAASRFVKKRERYMYNDPAPKDRAVVVFAQFSPDTSLSIVMETVLDSAGTKDTTSTDFATDLGFGEFAAQKLLVDNRTYKFYVKAKDTTLLTIVPSVAKGKSVTEVILNPVSSLTSQEFENK